MSLQFISVKCPQCGAMLDLENNRKQAFCTYCGTKILIDNNRDYEFTYRHVDEAEVKRAETEQLIRLKELDLAEKERAAEEKSKAIKIRISIVLAALGVLCMILGFSFHIRPNLSGLTIVGFIMLIAILILWRNRKKK